MPIGLFKVGADPEFSFHDREQCIEAHEVITHVRSKFGLDGCSSIAEMRPDPSINPSIVVANLHNDLINGYNSNPATRELYWKAGSMSFDDGDELYSTGGHIHFGIRGLVKYSRYGNKVDYYRRLAEFLDTYLAQPIRLLEDPHELQNRLDYDYGFLSDFRENSHGMEYRVLGSWLTSPRVAEGILCLAQTCVYQHLSFDSKNNPLNFDVLADISPKPETDEYGEETTRRPRFSKELKEYRKRFPQLEKDIRRFKLYKRYQQPIEFIFKLIEKEKTWYPGKGVDIKAAWGLTAAAPTYPTQIPRDPLPAVRFEDIWKRARN